MADENEQQSACEAGRDEQHCKCRQRRAAAEAAALRPIEQLADERQAVGMTKEAPFQVRQHPDRRRSRPVVQPAGVRGEDLLAGGLRDHRSPVRSAPVANHLRLAAVRRTDEKAHWLLRVVLPPPVAQGVVEHLRGGGPVR